MTTDSYKALESRRVDQELIGHLLQAFEASDTFPSTEQLEDTQPTVSIIDYPCGFGKTTTLIETIAQLSELKFLIVVQTLDEVRRVLQEAPEGRLKSPESPSTSGKTKSQQLEDLVLSGASIVITHALYERAGTLALEGGLNHYNVIIDEVPNDDGTWSVVAIWESKEHAQVAIPEIRKVWEKLTASLAGPPIIEVSGVTLREQL